MGGYNSLKQFVYDYRLYRLAKRIDSGREHGQTITSLIKQRMDQRLASASRSFKSMMRKNGYTKDDLMLIAAHDSLTHLREMVDFVTECFGTFFVSAAHYKKIISSQAFQKGRLKRLYTFIPIRIETKNELLTFIKRRYNLPREELIAIMSGLGVKKWRQWLDELLEKNKIHLRGRFIS